MKVTFTIQSASDGGVFITMDPPASALLEQQLAGRGGSVHTYALTAYRAVHDLAMHDQAAASGCGDAGGSEPLR